MRGASREALGALRDRVEELAGSGDPGGLGQVSEELFSVAGLLDHEGGLRRAMADPALPAGTKTQLVRAVLGTKLGEPTLRLLDEVVSARWSQPADLVSGLELLGVELTLVAAETDGELDDVEDELFRFARIVDREPGLLMALTDQRMPTDRKRELVHSLLEERARPGTLRLVEEAVTHPRGRPLDRALEEYAALAARRRHRLMAVVRVAVPLAEDEESRLAAVLGREFGSRMQLQVEVDAAVMGGVHVQVGDTVLDGTIAHRLAEARRRLVP